MNTNCAVILAGGQGKRMKSDLPKPMLKVLNEPMLDWVISACKEAEINTICVVTGYNSNVIEKHLSSEYTTVLQKERLGTGHAVMQCKDFLKQNIDGDTLVLCGDAPFIDEDTIRKALELHINENNSVTVVSTLTDNNFGYGRIIRENNGIKGIVEEKDCTDEQKAIKEVNSGVYWFKTKELLSSLEKIEPANAQGEYYLTDTIKILLGEGKKADAYVCHNEFICFGANTRKDLLELNIIAKELIIDKHLENGVEFTSYDGITIERSVKIGAGTQILPGTILRANTVIGENCIIGPNCLIESSTIKDNVKLNYVQAYESIVESNVKIGPFVQLRPNSHIMSGVKIGDFVEIKNSTIGENTAVAHLTYVGDTDVGSHVNFGCGCVTVNYDGVKKSRCTIGDGAFIGCNTNLIAPVTVGNGAYTAAGTTVTKNVPDNALAIDRGDYRIKEGYALRKLKDRNKK